MKFIGHPSDEASEEYADQGQVVQVVVPERPVRSPPKAPWLLIAVVVVAGLTVAAVAVVLTRSKTVAVPDGSVMFRLRRRPRSRARA